MIDRYKCLDCKATFNEPEWYSYEEDLNGEGAIWRYSEMICPQCHSSEVEENDDEEEDI